MQRDMTQKQFSEALVRHGMKGSGFMGYTNINVPGHHVEVSRYNGGSRLRSQLAYLLKCRDAQMVECKECNHMYADHRYIGKGNPWLCVKGCECQEFKS